MEEPVRPRPTRVPWLQTPGRQIQEKATSFQTLCEEQEQNELGSPTRDVQQERQEIVTPQKRQLPLPTSPRPKRMPSLRVRVKQIQKQATSFQKLCEEQAQNELTFPTHDAQQEQQEFGTPAFARSFLKRRLASKGGGLPSDVYRCDSDTEGDGKSDITDGGRDRRKQEERVAEGSSTDGDCGHVMNTTLVPNVRPLRRHWKKPRPSSAREPHEEAFQPFSSARLSSSALRAHGAIANERCEEGDESAYTIILDKTQGKMLGLSTVAHDGVSLVIESIVSGLAADWSERNPYQKVMIGDHIREVNGIRDDARAMEEECKKNTILTIRLCRKVVLQEQTEVDENQASLSCLAEGATTMGRMFCKDVLDTRERWHFRKLDPAQGGTAERDWRGYCRYFAITDSRLRYTHERISPRFGLGAHKGKPVADLIGTLLGGSTIAEHLPALVAVEWRGCYYVVFGNRRLYALKQFALRHGSWPHGHTPLVRIIVHTIPFKHIAEEKLRNTFQLKVMHAMSTTNGGESVSMR